MPDHDPSDARVIAALELALEADPAATPVRLHLAALLLASGENARALDHYTTVLTRDPLHRDALEGAAAAAEASGDTTRAASLRALLGAAAATPQPAAQRPGPASIAEDAGDDEDGEEPVRVGAGPSNDPTPWWEAAFTGITLRDVGGMEAVKRRLEISFLGPMRNPALRHAYRASLRGGLLLYGPPGCGKTYIARALAGEMGARFVSIGLDEVLDMWLGQSEKHIHEAFEQARRNAPCVLFFDELDAVGQKRTQLRNNPAQRGVVNQLLAELDGVDADNEGVFVLGATNHPWDVDSALLRPGRFDRTVLVLPPDEPARRQILEHHLTDRPVGGIDLDRLAAGTDGFSGADIAHLVESATELALEAAVISGEMRPIGMDDLTRALGEVRPSVRTWFETARNVVIFANQTGMYDELAAYMKLRKAL